MGIYARDKAIESKLNEIAKNVKGYSLINNYGYNFDYKGVHYDYRHWLNFYGDDVDFWSLYPRNEELEKMLKDVK